MAKPFREWTVLPHSPVTTVDDNVLTVQGTLHMPPMGEVERRMTIARLSDERLVIYSAIALGESEMKTLEDYGTPAFLIVPSDIHRMDVKAWKDRYQAIAVIAPPAARAKVEEIVPVDAETVDFGDPSVRYVVVPGTGGKEAALVIQREGGTTLVLNDLIFNLHNRPGLGGWFWKTIGMTGDEPHIPPVVKMREVKNKDALRQQLERWSHIPNLKRVIVSHGDIIEGEPAKVLERIAHTLAA